MTFQGGSTFSCADFVVEIITTGCFITHYEYSPHILNVKSVSGDLGPIVRSVLSWSSSRFQAVEFQEFFRNMHTHSYVNAGSKPTLACFYQTHFSGVSELEAKEKVVCYVYAYVEKKSRNGGITICSFNLNVARNWVWSNYHGTQQQLHARRDD